MFRALLCALESLSDLVHPKHELTVPEIQEVIRLTDGINIQDPEIQKQISTGPLIGTGMSVVIIDNRAAKLRQLDVMLMKDDTGGRGGNYFGLPQGYMLEAVDDKGQVYSCEEPDGRRTFNFVFKSIPEGSSVYLRILEPNAH